MGLNYCAIDFETANWFRGSPCAVGLVKVVDGAVVMVENIVRHLSRRILVMYLGKIVEAGEAKTTCRFPKHPYTQRLLEARHRIAHRRPRQPGARPRRGTPVL